MAEPSFHDLVDQFFSTHGAHRGDDGTHHFGWSDPMGNEVPSAPVRQNATPGDEAAGDQMTWGDVGRKAKKALTDPQSIEGYNAVAELTGIPGMMRGAEHVRQGLAEGNVLRGVGGAGEIALGALPGSQVVRPLARMVEPALATAPRAMATLTALAAPSAYADAADAAQAKRAQKADQAIRLQANEQNPDFVAHYNRALDARMKGDPEYAAANDALQAARAGETSLSGRPVAGSKQMDAQTRALTEAGGRVTRAQEAMDAIRQRHETSARQLATAIINARADAQGAADAVREGQPKSAAQTYDAWREDGHSWAPPMSMAPAVAGAAVGAVPGVKNLASSVIGRVEAGRAVKAARAAAAGTPEREAALNRANAFMEVHAPEATSWLDKSGASLMVDKTTLPAIGLGATMAGLPIGYDAMNLPSQNPEKASANAFFERLSDDDPSKAAAGERAANMRDDNPAKEYARDPSNYMKQMAIGGLEGYGGSKIGALLKLAKPDFANARAEIDALRPRGGGPLPGGPNSPGGAPGAPGAPIPGNAFAGGQGPGGPIAPPQGGGSPNRAATHVQKQMMNHPNRPANATNYDVGAGRYRGADGRFIGP